MHKNLNRLRSKSETSHAFLKTVMMNRLHGFLQALYKSVTEHFLCVSVNALSFFPCSCLRVSTYRVSHSFLTSSPLASSFVPCLLCPSSFSRLSLLPLPGHLLLPLYSGLPVCLFVSSRVSSLVLPCFIRYLYLLVSSSAYLIFSMSIYLLSLLFMSFLIYPFSSSFPRLPVTLQSVKAANSSHQKISKYTDSQQ